MLKHQKKGICQALAMLLALVLIVAMLPIAASAESAPAFVEGYPRLGATQADGSKKIEVLAKCIFPAGVEGTGISYVLLAKDDPSPTKEQIESAGSHLPGVTVITYGHILNSGAEQPIWLEGKQDATEYEFYIVCSNNDAISGVKHLTVTTPAADPENPGTPTLAAPTGLMWDTTDGIKAKWNTVNNADSYAVTLYKEGQSSMLVEYTVSTGTEVSVQSNIGGYTGNYYFTVQAKADGYSSVKPASQIYRHIAPLYGNTKIDNMSPKIGDTLTGSLESGNNTGTLHYTWKADDEPVGADAASYTVTAADLGKTITLVITSSVEKGTRTSAATAAVSEASMECLIEGCTTPAADGGFTESEMFDGKKHYHISSPAQLAHINEHLGLNYIQTADIDLSQYNEGVWSPIGGHSDVETYPFAGRYLGNGKKITGLTINIESVDGSTLYGGLFGKTDSFAHIEGIDLTLNNMSALLASSEASGEIYLGGIAAWHESARTIEDCHVTISGDITVENATNGGNVYVGGITGYNSGHITDCSTNTSGLGNVPVAANNGEAFVGGIAGRTQGYIFNSDHIGKLHAEASDASYTNRVYVGGICGYAATSGADTVIENCQNNADIKSVNNCTVNNTYRAYAGGIVGHIDWDLSEAWAVIKNCANIGVNTEIYTEAPSTMTGGIAGSSRFIDSTNIRIENCYNRSDVVSEMIGGGKGKPFGLNKGSGLCTGVTAGGIIGATGGMEILYSYSAAADISATALVGEDDYTGGIAGLIWGTRFSQNYYETNENANIGIGGAVISQTEIDDTQADTVGKVEGATATQLKTKSFFGDGWQWYASGGTAPDYYSAGAPWRFTAANSYPVLRGSPYTAPTPPSSGNGSGITYKITATANEGGIITPDGKVQVAKYGNITFAIKPDKNHLIEDILVDGISVGAVTTYTFSSVKADHTIEAVFAHDCPSKPYTDVDITQWYHEGVDYALLAGFFKGTSGATFEPNAPMTRAMLVTVLWRLENEPDATISTLFSDIADQTWYTDAVAWAAENMIVKGYDAETFGPEDPITREQMAAILYRYAGYKGYDISVGEDTNILSYEDALNISEYAIPAIQWACGAGIMQGDEAKLDPQGNATRAQVAAMLMRLIENVVR